MRLAMDTTPSWGYLLCCIERTGSNLLARALEATGRAGRPREYFNPVEQGRPWIRQILGDCDAVTGLPRILAAGMSWEGGFGAKIHWGHLRYLGLSLTGEWTEARRTELHDLLRSQCPDWPSQAEALRILWSGFADGSSLSRGYGLLRSHVPDLQVIWLRRTNMVARAVSMYRARRTGIWVREATQQAASLAVPFEAAELTEIHRLNCLGHFQEESWQRFFQEHGLTPHCVTYEDLVADYEATVGDVLGFLGVQNDSTPIAAPTSMRQADASSQEWELRYREASARMELEAPVG
jgi:LPS sulfotransferase NodH